MWNNGQTFLPGLLQNQLFHGNSWFTNDFRHTFFLPLCDIIALISLWLTKANMCLIWANVTQNNRERDLSYDFIGNACAIYGPVNESCSHSESNSTRPLKSCLPSVLIYLPPRTKGGEMLDSGRDNNQTSNPTVPKRGEGRQALSLYTLLPFLSHPHLPSLKPVISSNSPMARSQVEGVQTCKAALYTKHQYVIIKFIRALFVVYQLVKAIILNVLIKGQAYFQNVCLHTGSGFISVFITFWLSWLS